jgi:hypothetical protein
MKSNELAWSREVKKLVLQMRAICNAIRKIKEYSIEALIDDCIPYMPESRFAMIMSLMYKSKLVRHDEGNVVWIAEDDWDPDKMIISA